MANDENFYDKYLVVNAEEATLFDLIRVLLGSGSLYKRRIFECPEREKEKVLEEHRWLIFVSLLAQKLLLYSKKPMAWVGSHLEMWLNLVSSNGGLFRLLLNRIRDKVVVPKKSSPTFTSLLVYLDTRVELDKSIRNGDPRYNSLLAVMAAKIAYENEPFVKAVIRDHWKMEVIGFYNFWNDYQNLETTHAIMYQDKTADPDLIVVAFRGTSPSDADEWRTDVDISWYEIPNVGKIHGGFMKALGLQKNTGWPKELKQKQGPNQKTFAYYKIREVLRMILRKNERARFVVTGHSLGGALAILFVGVLGLHEEAWLLDRMEGVYTFGQPRVGDEQFGKFMMENMRVYDVKYFRYVYCNDVVPRLPYDDKTQLFKHFGSCLYYDSLYKGKVLKEEPDKNYFSLLWFIPVHLNAVWEIIRGVVLPYAKGAEYKESTTLTVFRLIGLVLPGLADHGLEDYDNLTRLGSYLTPLQPLTSHEQGPKQD